MKLLRALFLLPLALGACADPSDQQHGSFEITTSSTTSTSGFTTADGWKIEVKHFFVSFTEVTVGSDDGVGAASATAQVVDEAVAGPKSLLFASVRTARPWEQVGFRIGPAAVVDDVGPAPVGSVTQADIDALVKAGASVAIDGRASRGADTKTFVWGFTTDTIHSDCTGDVDGASRRGLLVTPDGTDTADVVLSSSALFSDHLEAAAGALRFDAVAAADADKDGSVTLEELAAVSLAPLRTATPGAYVAADDVTDLGAYTAELTRSIVASFRAKGRCTAAAAPAPEEPSAPTSPYAP